jgi:Rps23 Pro-64 3,4-dihydroxylase Tpa1-like proline 4-hydroxylase
MHIEVDSLQYRETPYRYFTGPKFYNPATAAQLLEVCEANTCWEDSLRSYYRIQRCRIRSHISVVNKGVGDIFPLLANSDNLCEIRERVETWFDTKICIVDVAVNRMTPGHWIGVHNDHWPNDPPSYRMVIWLTRLWTTGMGGETLILKTSKASTVVETLKPLHNSLWIFETGRSSYHAVSPVLSGVRFTVAYEFWPAYHLNGGSHVEGVH